MILASGLLFWATLYIIRHRMPLWLTPALGANS